ncbi:hypothetical protein GCM10018963_51640 [Saccharothrix longispora]
MTNFRLSSSEVDPSGKPANGCDRGGGGSAHAADRMAIPAAMNANLIRDMRCRLSGVECCRAREGISGSTD